jgi:hypothetical protein
LHEQGSEYEEAQSLVSRGEVLRTVVLPADVHACAESNYHEEKTKHLHPSVKHNTLPSQKTHEKSARWKDEDESQAHDHSV